jgi:hypothetical protein
MVLNIFLKQAYKDAAAFTKEVTKRHDVPNNAPDDLRNTTPQPRYTSGWKDVASIALVKDFSTGADAPAAAVTALILASVVGVVGVMFHFVAVALALAFLVLAGTDAIAAMFVSLALITPYALPLALFAALIIVLETREKGNKRGHSIFGDSTRKASLYLQTMLNSTAHRYVDYFKHNALLRQKQSDEANRDDSALIEIGEATGYLESHEDGFAPSPGAQMRLSLRDLSTHLFFFGRTGAGKTVGIKKVLSQISGSNSGMFVVCGKGTLPGELEGTIDGFKLLNPEQIDLDLFAGLSPNDVVDALATRGEKVDEFFYGAARTFMKHNAVLLYYAAQDGDAGEKFDAASLREIMQSNSHEEASGDKVVVKPNGIVRMALMSFLKPSDNEQVKDAIAYFDTEFKSLFSSEKTFAGVLTQAMGWLNPLFSHEKLARWTSQGATPGFDIGSVVSEGARVGVDVPAVKYGQEASIAIANLCRQRLYSAAKLRGNVKQGDTGVALVMDEMHLIWQQGQGGGDGDMVSIGRSLGLTFICATQSIDELESRIGDKNALAALGNFRSVVSFAATEKTMNYMAGRAGYILRSHALIDDEKSEQNGINLQHDALLRSIATSVEPKQGFLPSAIGGLKRVVVGEKREMLGDGEAPYVMPKIAGRSVTYAATAEELTMQLEQKHSAICVLNRASHPRRDVALILPPVAAA